MSRTYEHWEQPSVLVSTPAQRGVQLLVLTLAASAAIFARFTVSPLQETMGTALSLTDNQVALLQGPAVAIPMTLGAIPIGMLIDRYSRARLIFILAVLDVLGTVATALATSFELLFAARCLVGLTATATSIAAYSVLADLYAPAQRGRASITVAMGEVAGASAAFAMGGALLMSYGASDGWRSTLLWLSAPLVGVAFLVLALREPLRTGVTARSPSLRDAVTQLWRYRSVLSLLVVGRVMVGIADGAALIWAAPTFAREFKLPPDHVGAIMGTALLVSGIAGPIAGGFLADLCQRAGGPRRTVFMLMCLALICIPTSLFSVMPNVTGASMALTLFLTACGATIVIVTTLTTVVIPNEVRGVSMSVLFASGVVFGIGLAPLSVSALAGAMGGPDKIGLALAAVGAATMTLAAVIFAFGRRRAAQMGTFAL